MSYCKPTFISRAVTAMVSVFLVMPHAPSVAHEGHDLGINVEIPLLLSARAREGKQVYQMKCLSCHGNNLEGTHSGPSLIPYDRAHHPDGDFFRAIRKGVPEHHWNFGNMPPMKDLADDEIENVIAYVRELQAYNNPGTNHDLDPN